MAAEVKDSLTLLGMLESGDFRHDLQNAIDGLVGKLQDAAGRKGKAKGSIALKLNFEAEGVSLHVAVEDIKVTAPKVRRETSMFFINDGKISLEHPKQISMFPRDVDKGDRPAVAAGD